jgi:hypothetical protein
LSGWSTLAPLTRGWPVVASCESPLALSSARLPPPFCRGTPRPTAPQTIAIPASGSTFVNHRTGATPTKPTVATTTTTSARRVAMRGGSAARVEIRAGTAVTQANGTSAVTAAGMPPSARTHVSAGSTSARARVVPRTAGDRPVASGRHREALAKGAGRRKGLRCPRSARK